MSPEEAAWQEAAATARAAEKAAKEAHLIAVYEECDVHWDACYQAKRALDLALKAELAAEYAAEQAKTQKRKP